MKIRIYIPVLLATVLFSSCEGYLDKPMETTNNEDFVFANYTNVRNVVFSMYSDLPRGLSEISGSAMIASACDEAEFAVQSNSVQKFNRGSWSATDNPDNPISRYYAAYRKAFNFLANLEKVNFDDVKDNPAQPGVYEKQLKELEYMKSEVMLLRAYYMFEIAKRYGGMPIVTGKFSPDVDYSTIQRAPLQACVDTIVFWCDKTAKALPVKHEDQNHGRLNKGAALALKSQVLLFAASELWNNPSWAAGYSHPEYISLDNSKTREQRWKEAADAAKELIDLSAEAGYALDTYDNIYGTSAHKSKEIIVPRMDDASNSFEKVNLPIHHNNVTGGNNPSGNLVDLFQNLDGSKFVWNDVTKKDPFTGRDPRLDAFIVTNNSLFKGETVEAWTGGKDGAPVRNATATGYYLKKFVNPNLNLNNNQTSRHFWIITRLPEIYLNYIEALNEYKPGDPDIAKYYDEIRTRAGMPALPSGLNQAQVRELIRNERAVELCFEGKRFWDLRRWMDKTNLSAPLRGLEITKNETGFEYKEIKVEDRVFEDKMYFYPIPQAELNKMPHWIQNPLW